MDIIKQGSKRMVKFLLRRGDNINAQNLTGNTALHFCYEYSHTELGEYLKSRVLYDLLFSIITGFNFKNVYFRERMIHC